MNNEPSNINKKNDISNKNKSPKIPIKSILDFSFKIMMRRKLRLVFSVILPVIIFLIFGISIGALRFDKNKEIIKELYKRDINFVTMSTDIDFYQKIKNIDISSLESKTDAYPVFIMHSGDSVVRDYSGGIALFDNYNDYLSKEFNIKQDVLMSSKTSVVVGNSENFDKGVLFGKMPSSGNEFAITDIMYNYILQNGCFIDGKQNVKVSDFVELTKIPFATIKPNASDINFDMHDMFLSGVIKTNYKLNDYYDDNGNSKKIYTKYQMSLLMTTALMPIVTSDFVDDCKNALGANNISFFDFDEHNLSMAAIKLTGNIEKDKNITNDYLISTNPLLWKNSQSFVLDGVKILFYIAIVASVLVLLLIVNFVSVTMSSNQKLIGTLRSLGIRKKDVFGIFFFESFFIGLVMTLLSFALSAILSHILANTLFYPIFLIDVITFLSMLGFVLVITLVSVLIPILIFSKKSISKIIKTSN